MFHHTPPFLTVRCFLPPPYTNPHSRTFTSPSFSSLQFPAHTPFHPDSSVSRPPSPASLLFKGSSSDMSFPLYKSAVPGAFCFFHLRHLKISSRFWFLPLVLPCSSTSHPLTWTAPFSFPPLFFNNVRHLILALDCLVAATYRFDFCFLAS